MSSGAVMSGSSAVGGFERFHRPFFGYGFYPYPYYPYPYYPYYGAPYYFPRR